MLAKYQYMLQAPVSAVSGNKLDSLISLLEFYMDSETDNEDAEKFSAYSLNTLPGKYKSEEVLFYGIEPNSKYVKIDFDNEESSDEDGSAVSADTEEINEKQTIIVLTQEKIPQAYIFPVHMQINS